MRDASVILVVEDEAIVAREIQRSLVDLGYQAPPPAASCEEAVARASDRCPDLVLMDIRIQGQRDGIETAGILRRRFGVPVVFLTAYSDDLTLERAKRAQPYGYLIKPITGAELRSAVEVALYKHEIDVRLGERERSFAAALRSLGDAVVATDREARITFMNPVAEGLTGWGADDVIGRPVGDVLRLAREDTREPVESCAFRVLREAAATRAADGTVLIGKDGAERPIEEIAAPILDDGELRGAVVVFRDAEPRRLHRQTELEDRLTSISTMAAGVASEINDPVAGIVSSVESVSAALKAHRRELKALFFEESYPSLFKRIGEMESVLGEAAEGAGRIAKVVSELRSFARPPARRHRSVDLRRVLSSAGEVVAPEIRARAGLAMEIGHVPPVSGDEPRLAQVFVNLLLNAAQAISPGNAAANEVRVTGKTAPDGRALVEVRDTGCGIPGELLGRIFDPFFTTNTVGGGTGLGLSICHGIVRSLGGEIRVESEVGHGSVFRVFLPPAQVEAAASFSSDSAPRRPGRILVIDAEPVAATAIRRTLEPEHQATCVASVREGWALIERGEVFDAVLCDLVLPEVTGMDFYDDLLRARPDVARRVIFMSSAPLSRRAEEFVASVSNRCLDRPFAPEILRVAVRQTLAASGA